MEVVDGRLRRGWLDLLYGQPVVPAYFEVLIKPGPPHLAALLHCEGADRIPSLLLAPIKGAGTRKEGSA
jgi:hypothetical protein